MIGSHILHSREKKLGAFRSTSLHTSQTPFLSTTTPTHSLQPLEQSKFAMLSGTAGSVDARQLLLTNATCDVMFVNYICETQVKSLISPISIENRLCDLLILIQSFVACHQTSGAQIGPAPLQCPDSAKLFKRNTGMQNAC